MFLSRTLYYKDPSDSWLHRPRLLFLSIYDQIRLEEGSSLPVPLYRLAYTSKGTLDSDAFKVDFFPQLFVPLSECPPFPIVPDEMEERFMLFEVESLATHQSLLAYLELHPAYLDQVVASSNARLHHLLSGVAQLAFHTHPEITKKILLHPQAALLKTNPIDKPQSYMMSPLRYAKVLQLLLTKGSEVHPVVEEIIQGLDHAQISTLYDALFQEFRLKGSWGLFDFVLLLHRDFVAKLDDKQLKGVIEEAMSHPKVYKNKLTKMIVSKGVIERLSNKQLSDYLDLLVHDRQMDSLIQFLESKAAVQRVSNSALFYFMQGTFTFEEFNHPFFVRAMTKLTYVNARLSPELLSDFLMNKLSSNSPVTSAMFSNKKFMDKIPDQVLVQVSRFVIKNSATISPETLAGFAHPIMVHRLTGRVWTLLLMKLVALPPDQKFFKVYFDNAPLLRKVINTPKAISSIVKVLLANPGPKGQTVQLVIKTAMGRAFSGTDRAILLRRMVQLGYSDAVNDIMDSTDPAADMHLSGVYQELSADTMFSKGLSGWNRDRVARHLFGQHETIQKVLPRPLHHFFFPSGKPSRNSVTVQNSVLAPSRKAHSGVLPTLRRKSLPHSPSSTGLTVSKSLPNIVHHI